MRIILALITCCCLAGSAADRPVPKTFESGIDDYMKLRKRATKGISDLKPTDDPARIEAHEQALARAIRSARVDAKQGDVLGPQAGSYLVEIVRSEMKGAAGKPAKETAKQGNPGVDPEGDNVPVKINAIYPDGAPASTVPASLLLRLPKLPKELDFRFVGRHLVLRDVPAGLIIDFIPNAMP